MNGIIFVTFLIIIATLKQILSILNSHIYTNEYQNVLNENQSGYFGVGLYRPKLGINEVCLIVIDDNSMIKDCRLIRGISIFAKFHHYDAVVEQSYNSSIVTDSRHYKVVRKAIDNAQRQLKKQ